MQEQNETLGNYLKRMREERNVSIEQVAYATRISLKMLRALEQDDHTALPAPTFVRGYLQAYAKYVRLDTQDLLLRYQHHLATAPDAKKGAIKSHYLYVRERYQEKRQLVLVIVLFAAMLSVAGTYFLLKAKRERHKTLAKQAEQIQKTAETIQLTTQETTSTSTVTSHLSASNSATATVTATTTKTVETPKPTLTVATHTATLSVTQTATSTSTKSTEAALAQPTAPAVVDRPKDEKKTYNILLKASEDVWLRFQTDNDEVRDLTLRQGKAMMLRADKVVKIFSGNLGAIKATLNGSPIDSLATDTKSKSAVLPSSEAPNFPLPLFPQFQTTTKTIPKAPDPAPTTPQP